MKISLMEMLTNNQYDLSDGFILTYIESLNPNPFNEWLTQDVAYSLDIEYMTKWDSLKCIGLTTLYYLNKNNNDVEDTIKDLANLILTKFKMKWNRLYYDFWNNDLNPLADYIMDEHKEINTNVSVNASANVFGFNTTSDDGIPDTKSNSNSQGSKDDNYYDLHREGLNSRTIQELTEAELELLKKNFYDIILNDISSVVCLSVFK